MRRLARGSGKGKHTAFAIAVTALVGTVGCQPRSSHGERPIEVDYAVRNLEQLYTDIQVNFTTFPVPRAQILDDADFLRNLPLFSFSGEAHAQQLLDHALQGDDAPILVAATQKSTRLDKKYAVPEHPDTALDKLRLDATREWFLRHGLPQDFVTSSINIGKIITKDNPPLPENAGDNHKKKDKEKDKTAPPAGKAEKPNRPGLEPLSGSEKASRKRMGLGLPQRLSAWWGDLQKRAIPR